MKLMATAIGLRENQEEMGGRGEGDEDGSGEESGKTEDIGGMGDGVACPPKLSGESLAGEGDGGKVDG